MKYYIFESALCLVKYCTNLAIIMTNFRNLSQPLSYPEPWFPSLQSGESQGRLFQSIKLKLKMK